MLTDAYRSISKVASTTQYSSREFSDFMQSTSEATVVNNKVHGVMVDT